jgi:hypothetical protein
MIHIYALSHLYDKKVTAWKAEVERQEADQKFQYVTYGPLHRAIIKELRRPGIGKEELDLQLLSIARMPHAKSVSENSRVYLDTFLTKFLPLLPNFIDDYLGDPSTPPVTLGGEEIKGNFHFCAHDPNGERRFCYLHASKWSKQEITGHLELLTMIAEKRFGVGREAVWMLDLPKGELCYPEKDPKRIVKLRKELTNAVEIYQRLFTK